MPETLTHIVEDNAESILEQYYGADEATAIVKEECTDPKAFMMEIKYEGELEDTDEVFFADTGENEQIQYVKILNVVDSSTALASYTFQTPEGLQKTIQELREKSEG